MLYVLSQAVFRDASAQAIGTSVRVTKNERVWKVDQSLGILYVIPINAFSNGI